MGGLKHRLQESTQDGGDAGEGGERRPTPAEMNASRNAERTRRMQQIANRVDGGRAADFADTADGVHIDETFQGGEFDDTPEAREQRELQADEEARVALEEAAARAEAENLQAEGAGEGEGGEAPASRRAAAPAGDDAPEERVVEGVRQYLVMTPKGEKWLTFPQLKALAQKAESVDQALQTSNEAVRRATQLDLSPREEPSEELSDEQIEAVVSSAVMGDREAIKKLSTLVKPKLSKTPDVSAEVQRAIATRSAVEQARQSQKDIFEVEALVPVFNARLRQVADAEPDLSIQAAYAKAGAVVRREFAPMLKTNPRTPEGRAERKRNGYVTPPTAAARQTRGSGDEEGEGNPSSDIDAIAKARGQSRAIRHGRNLSQG